MSECVSAFRGSPAGRDVHSVWDKRIPPADLPDSSSCRSWAGPARCYSDAPEPDLSRLEISSSGVSGESVCLSVPCENHPHTPLAKKKEQIKIKKNKKKTLDIVLIVPFIHCKCAVSCKLPFL